MERVFRGEGISYLEVRHVSEDVQTLRDDGVATDLHKIKSRGRYNVTGTEKRTNLVPNFPSMTIELLGKVCGRSEIVACLFCVLSILPRDLLSYYHKNVFQFFFHVHGDQMTGEQQFVVHECVRIICGTLPFRKSKQFPNHMYQTIQLGSKIFDMYEEIS